MSLRDFARRALRSLALPVPQHSGRTLNVFVEDTRALPNFRIHCACPLVASYVWRTAHEHGCDTIRVHASASHRHEFDTTDFLRKFTIARLGYVPQPVRMPDGKTPQRLATAGHRALGNELEYLRHYVRGHHPISGEKPVEV